MDRIGNLITHLPAQPTPLVGRSRDLDVATERLLLEEARLLTLTGPAGVGKTRLAIAVAARVADAFPDGAWFVDLTPIRDTELVPSAIAQALGVHATRSTSVAERLVAFLESRGLLLVLDNFETVLPAATFVATLLAASPGLKVLVSSRERLRLRWERTFAVAPLALPDLHTPYGVDTLSQVAAVALFVDRARAADADFALTSANAPAVAEICVRLDGLPFAIELAAARANVLPPARLLARLDRLGLHWEAPDLPRRHQTLRAAFDCSYDLLTADEQALLPRLAVFAGGWTLEAAERVADQGDGAADALDGLAALADKSLIRALPCAAEDEPRFNMLETIRDYALEQLRTNGEVELIRRRHAAYFLELAERIEPALLGAQQRQLLDVLEREHDDLRAALHWAADTREASVELRLATALAYFWRMRGHLAEGRRRLEAALERGPAAAHVRARALDRCATLATWQGDYERVTRQLDEALVLAQTSDDSHTAAEIFASMAVAAWNQQAFDRAVTLSEEGLHLRRRQGDTLGLALALRNLGPQLLSVGNHERSRAVLEESLGLFRDLGGQRDCAVILGALADVALVQGDVRRAIALLLESLPLARAVAD
jgi:predicted ATPase